MLGAIFRKYTIAIYHFGTRRFGKRVIKYQSAFGKPEAIV